MPIKGIIQNSSCGLNPLGCILVYLLLKRFVKTKGPNLITNPGKGGYAIALLSSFSLTNHVIFGAFAGAITFAATRNLQFSMMVGGIFTGAAFLIQTVDFLVRLAIRLTINGYKGNNISTTDKVLETLNNSLKDAGFLYFFTGYAPVLGYLNDVCVKKYCAKSEQNKTSEEAEEAAKNKNWFLFNTEFNQSREV